MFNTKFKKGYYRNRKKPADGVKKRQNILSDHTFEIGTPKQAADFSKVQKWLINHIRNEYHEGEDIATALEERKEFDFSSHVPALDTSYDATLGQEHPVNIGYMSLFKAEMQAHVDRRVLQKLLFQHRK